MEWHGARARQLLCPDRPDLCRGDRCLSGCYPQSSAAGPHRQGQLHDLWINLGITRLFPRFIHRFILDLTSLYREMAALRTLGGMKPNSSSKGAQPARIPSNQPPVPGQPNPGQPSSGQPSSGQPSSGQPSPGQAPVKVGSPAEILAAVPSLLGFHPTHSLVVIGARPPRDRVHVSFRYDLLGPSEGGSAREIAAHAPSVLVHQQITVAIIVGYGPGALVTPIAEEFRARLGEAGVEVREMLRVEDGQYWSYLCQDPGCCPPDGVPFDVSASSVAAQMTLAGNVTLQDRAALEHTVAPLGGVVRASMAQATIRAEHRAAALVAHAGRSGRKRGGILRPVVDDGLRAVREAIDTYRDSGRGTSHHRIPWPAVPLRRPRVAV